MKTQLIAFCLFISVGFAGAATQTVLNQDKPSQIYIKKYYMTDSGSYDNTYDPFFGGNNTVTFSASVPNWSDWTSGTATLSSHLTQTGESWFNGQLEPYYDTGDVTVNWSWPKAKWPNLSATQNISYNYVDSPGTSQYGSGSFANSNQPAPVFMEHCDMSVNTSYTGDGVTFISENRTAQATVKLRTGGKATSKLRNLFAITVGANQITPNNPYDVYLGMNPLWGFTGVSGYLFERVNGTNIPSQNIAVGSYGNLNANGVLYKILPDNADVDVTPSIAGVDYYNFGVGRTKYQSYFEVFVNQPNPGTNYTLTDTTGHAFWQFKTDAPADALQYITASLTNFVNRSWGFYPHGSNCGLAGQLQNDSIGNNGNGHPYSVKKVFYIGFPDLINGLEFTRGISNAPPIYCFAAYGYSCVGAATDAGYSVGITLPTWWNPWNWMPQNFGAAVALKYPGPLADETPRYSN